MRGGTLIYNSFYGFPVSETDAEQRAIIRSSSSVDRRAHAHLRDFMRKGCAASYVSNIKLSAWTFMGVSMYV